ncbi:bifunctional metallophosphatase/5'-nucleotidase [Lentilactobacillus sp. Marseille-Q4993]|uniref:bifunctional metallophosphatase/5'-nucleotidase n=1 Tax=Lentilactobacillus sp. Marseille-Q4993 TaxID=3039492 RepID=UPI0024BC3AF7|nr:bifunctional metallophosphatase/5'-nucleotidase [Lentilactobacillus sp. Marseille-Q4993]
MTEKITILHTNDIHSHFENWPKIRRFLLAQKEQLEKQDDSSVITVDLGDALDRAHPLTEVTNGTANVDLLNQIHYDAVTIGNNEGLTNTHQQLNELYRSANFDVVLANLLDIKNKLVPEWAEPSKIITTKNGTKVLIIGLTAPYTLTYPILGWQPISPEKVLPKVLAKNKGKFDVAVLLSHLGINQDRKLAKEFPWLDVIIGSHTHHLLKNGELVNHSLLAAAEKWGHYIGRISLEIDDKHKIVAEKAETIKTDELDSLPSDRQEIKGYEVHGEQLLAKNKLAKTTMAMTTSLSGPSKLVDEGLKAIMEKAGTNIAMLNAGLFLQNLPAGVVDRNILHKMLPHSMHVMRVGLNGYDLWRLVMEMEKNHNFLIRFPQKGMGFRGTYFGELHYAGIEFDKAEGRLYHNGKLVLPENHYEIAVPDHYLFIPFFPTIDIVGENKILYDESLRDVFGDYLAKHYPLNS